MKKTEDQADLLTDVPVHLGKVLRTLEELQSRLDVEMNSGLAGSAGAGVNAKHVTLAAKLASASSSLGRETRAWMRKVKETAGAATLEERCAAVTTFIKGLPPKIRKKIVEDVNEDL